MTREEEGEEDDGSVDWLTQLNPNSLIVHKNALMEPALAEFAGNPLETQVQLQRLGFFAFDKDSTVGMLRAQPHRHPQRIGAQEGDW